MKDSLCDPSIIGSLLGRTKEACVQEYNKSGVDPNRPVKVSVMTNHEETNIPAGCQIKGVNADGTYSADGGSNMELNKARAKFKLKCPNTIKDGKITVVFKREKKQNETWPDDSKYLQTKITFDIRSNANVRFSEVLNGRAVYVYDENTESKTSWSTINQTPTNETRGFDYVQELFNQVMPRKRKGYDNYDSVLPIDNNYKLIEEDGIYDNYAYNALLDFKQHFKLGINRKVGSYTIENKYSADDETSPTFRKLMKDYSKRQVGNPWLIGDNTTDTWRHKVIDKETLTGLNGYQPTDTEVTLTTAATTGNVVTSTGLYELYNNVVKPFVDEMLKEGERYRNYNSKTWYARTGEQQGLGIANGSGMSYSYGGKQTVEAFDATVVRTAPPTEGNVPQNYMGNINEQTRLPDTGIAAGTRRWSGLINTELNTGEERHNAFAYWSGIDCSGFMQRIITKGKQSGSSVKVMIKDLTDTDNDRNKLDDGALGSWEFLNDANKTYRFDWNAENPVPTLKWIHKGDMIEYNGHNAMVYSDEASCKTTRDSSGNSTTTCTYEIIHAYGVDNYMKKVGTKREKTFSRKVIVTPNDISTTISNPTGFGRIKLWD